MCSSYAFDNPLIDTFEREMEEGGEGEIIWYTIDERVVKTHHRNSAVCFHFYVH